MKRIILDGCAASLLLIWLFSLEPARIVISGDDAVPILAERRISPVIMPAAMTTAAFAVTSSTGAPICLSGSAPAVVTTLTAAGG